MSQHIKYYSTSGKAPMATLEEAVVHGLASDKGLFMPETIGVLPQAFFNNIGEMNLTDIAYVVANTLFGGDIESEELKRIVSETLNFDIPLVHVDENRYALELYHGPTLAFKDVALASWPVCSATSMPSAAMAAWSMCW